MLIINIQPMEIKALERAGEADRVKCCVQTDRTKDLIPALFFIYMVQDNKQKLKWFEL